MSPHSHPFRMAAPRLLAAASLAVAGAATFLGTLGATPADAASKQFAVYTSVQFVDNDTECPNGGGNGVNCNIYNAKTEVFLNGGPASDFLPDGEYCFSVYSPNGKELLSSDLASNRAFSVSGGIVTYGGTHALGLDSREQPATTTIGFFPFDDTPNPGGVYKFSLYKYESPVVHSGAECNEDHDISKTDNFKVADEDPTPSTEPEDVEVTICKVVLDNQDNDLDGGSFGFSYNAGAGDVDFNLTADESSGPACETISLPAGGSMTAAEVDTPAGWENLASYPRYSLDGGPLSVGSSKTWNYVDGDKIVFYNKEESTSEETPPPSPTPGTPTTETTPPVTETPPASETPPPAAKTTSPTPVVQEQQPEPTPVETVAGVKSTPVPPSAGTGLVQQDGGSLDLLLILIGAVTGALGLGSLAFEARRK